MHATRSMDGEGGEEWRNGSTKPWMATQNGKKRRKRSRIPRKPPLPLLQGNLRARGNRAPPALPGSGARRQLTARSHPHQRNQLETAFTKSKTRFCQLRYELSGSTHVKNHLFHFAKKTELVQLFQGSRFCTTPLGVLHFWWEPTRSSDSAKRRGAVNAI